MKSPEQIAREIVKTEMDEVFRDCPFDGHFSAARTICTECLVDRIAAAILAERDSPSVKLPQEIKGNM